MTQASLDRAFRVRQRSSKYVFIYGRNRFVILSGKNTGVYGIIDITLDGIPLRTTNLGRTLVDIVVRPVMAVAHTKFCPRSVLQSITYRSRSCSLLFEPSTMSTPAIRPSP